jgi:hypothetical protein
MRMNFGDGVESSESPTNHLFGTARFYSGVRAVVPVAEVGTE